MTRNGQTTTLTLIISLQSLLCTVALNANPNHSDSTTWNWTGAYFGGHCGTALGKFEVGNPYGLSIYGDIVRTPGFIGGVQLGYNSQLPQSRWIFGLEAALSGLDADGTNTCFAYNGRFISSNVAADPDMVAQLTARLGCAMDCDGKTFVYLKGGVALLDNKFQETNNNPFGKPLNIFQTNNIGVYLGGSVGAGLEYALNPCASIRLEYEYFRFADSDIHAPTSVILNPDLESVSMVNATNTTAKQELHQIVFGFNYHLQPNCGNARLLCEQVDFEQHLQVGLRYWYSFGRFQKDLPLGLNSSSLVSRLVYDDIRAHTGELFTRWDTCYPVYAKGFIGIGRIVKGQMNDEDWGLVLSSANDEPPTFIGYSNTFSDLDHTDLHFATLDFGYKVINRSCYNLGIFAGYNHIKEQYIASDISVVSPEANPYRLSGRAVITETDKWNSLRVGVDAQAEFTPCWHMMIDAAYLPYVHFSGEDHHWLRGLTINEISAGRGVQLDVAASYQVCAQGEIGCGFRYWAIWANDGTDKFDGESVPRVDIYRHERYGAFLQGSLRF